MLSMITGKVSLAIGAGLLAVIGVLGWLYKDTKAELTEVSSNYTSLDLRYKNLEKELETKQESDKQDKKLIGELNELLKQKSNSVDDVGQVIDSRIKAIETKYDKLDKTENNRLAKQQEISSERIKGLWASYCIANPKHARCIVK